MSSRTSGRRVGARSFAPPAELADIVATLWTGRWDLRGQAPHTTERVPDPCANIVFEDLASLGCRSPATPAPSASRPGALRAQLEVGNMPGSRLVGPWTRLWRRTLEGAGHVRGVKLRAGALGAIVREPAYTFADRIVPLATLFPGVARLERAVLDPDDDEAAFGALCDWLVARRRRRLPPEMMSAIRLVELVTTDVRVTSVERMAERTGIGVRELQRRFREHVGVTPKRVIRTARLQEVAVRIERGAAANLAALAAELGYTDQAHMARDWKAVTGRSPSGFARSLRD